MLAGRLIDVPCGALEVAPHAVLGIAAASACGGTCEGDDGVMFWIAVEMHEAHATEGVPRIVRNQDRTCDGDPLDCKPEHGGGNAMAGLMDGNRLIIHRTGALIAAFSAFTITLSMRAASRLPKRIEMASTMSLMPSNPSARAGPIQPICARAPASRRGPCTGGTRRQTDR